MTASASAAPGPRSLRAARELETIIAFVDETRTELPSVSALARRNRDPFAVLVSTIISLRTKDAVTGEATQRLLTAHSTSRSLQTAAVDEIEHLIYPAGFYRVKARQLRDIGELLEERHGGNVPDRLELLLELPGVGRKTANLVLGLGFGVPAICVDIHVHRIANRLGWVSTRGPDETERILIDLLPRDRWIATNGALVAFGQRTCTPTSPFCSRCPVSGCCPAIGVPRKR